MDFTICILGEDGVGKTSFIQKQNIWGFREGVAQLETGNHGLVILRIKILHFSEYEKSNHDADIIMYDLTRPSTLNILKQLPETNRPRIIVGNKSDLKDEIKMTDYDKNKMGYIYYDISTKTERNVTKPVQYLLSELVNR